MDYHDSCKGWSPHMSPALKALLFSSVALMFVSVICICLAGNLTNMSYPFAFVLSFWSIMVSVYGLLLYRNKYLVYRLDPSAASDPWIRGYSNLLFITGVLSFLTVVFGPVGTPQSCCAPGYSSEYYSVGWTIMIGIVHTVVSLISTLWLRKSTNCAASVTCTTTNRQQAVYTVRESTPVLSSACQPGQSSSSVTRESVTPAHFPPAIADGYQLPYHLDQPPSYAEISSSNSSTAR